MTNNHTVSRGTKRFWALFSVVIVLAAIVILPIHTRSPLNEHHMRVVDMLKRVYPNIGGCCVISVTLGNGATLFPDRPKIISGYVYELKVKKQDYEIVAKPEQVGVTGLRSFRVDSDGRIFVSESKARFRTMST